MTTEGTEFHDELVGVAPALADTLDARVEDARRRLSPDGMRAWKAGACAFARLGRGADPLLAYLDGMVPAAEAAGETMITEVTAAVLKLVSLTSGAVVARVLETLPTAARRLGDPDLMLAYLQLVHQLASRSPRGLRPMLDCLDELLGKLSLSGLKRWVEFGIDAYRQNFAGQARYFGLLTEDSRAVLQRERRGTLFIDSQRRLNFYLRAFWGRDFFLRPAAADVAEFRPYIEQGSIHLPDAVEGQGEIGGLDLYRAMAAHAAAHVAYTAQALEPAGLSPAEQFFVGLVEDARVELRAMEDFPGLGRVWRSLGRCGSEQVASTAALARVEGVARALVDPGQSTGDAGLDPLVDEIRHALTLPDAPARVRHCGIALHRALNAFGPLPSLRQLERCQFCYRDDNRWLWHGDEVAWFDPASVQAQGRQQVRRKVSMMEFVNGLDVETAGDDAQEVWVLDGVLYDDDGTTWNEREGKEPVSEPVLHPEWDYRVQLHRPDWVTVFERRGQKGDPKCVDDILTTHRPIVSRIRQIIDRMRPQGVTRVRKLEDGDELDLNAAVDAMVALRSGHHPDMRITMRNVLHRRDLSVLLLLDLSASTCEKVAGADKSVLDLTREASVLLATAINGIGDPFAIHGFASDGRHDLRYTRFKDFEQNLDENARARLAGMSAGLSTRMGAAMRHAGLHLRRQPSRRKLLLVLTDGEPADIDERDPQTLILDTKKAVEELATRGVQSYCLSLDPNADRYVERIFGGARYTVVDRVERLPEKLPQLFASLTR